MSLMGQTRKSALVTAMSAFPPDSDQIADIAGGPFRAMNGLMHRSKQPLYSIDSSARPSSESGTVRPSAFAVLRLMINSTLNSRKPKIAGSRSANIVRVGINYLFNPVVARY